MKRVMAVFAHPDDEGAVGGTLTKLANADNSEVMLVCATRGEVGEISDPALATRDTLPEVRTKELETAVDILGIQHLRWLDYRDSGMVGTSENEDPRALVQANDEEVVGKIKTLVNEYLPDVVITFEPFGWYGHPDHRAVYQHVTVAHKQLTAEGLNSTLFYAVIPIEAFKKSVDLALALGIIDEGEIGFFEHIPYEQQLATQQSSTHVIDVEPVLPQKEAARSAHRTQFGDDNLFNQLPKDSLPEILGKEYFIQVAPPPANGASEGPQSDLFDLA